MSNNIFSNLLGGHTFKKTCTGFCSWFLIIDAALVICISFSVITGWVFNIEILKNIADNFASMSFSTAIAFLMSGIVLLLLNQTSYRSRMRSVIVPLFSVIIFMFMGTFLVSSYMGVTTGLEDAFFIEQNDFYNSVPGRPSLATSFGFILFSVAGVLAAYKFPYDKKPFKIISLTLIVIGLLALLGYLLSLPFLYFQVADFSGAMALHTALLFIFLGTGLYYFSR